MQNNKMVMFRIQKVNCSITTFTHLIPSDDDDETVVAMTAMNNSNCLILLYVLFLMVLDTPLVLAVSLQLFFIPTGW